MTAATTDTKSNFNYAAAVAHVWAAYKDMHGVHHMSQKGTVTQITLDRKRSTLFTSRCAAR